MAGRLLVTLGLMAVCCCLHASALQHNQVRLRLDNADSEPGLDRVKRSKRHTLQEALQLLQDKRAEYSPHRKLLRVKRAEPDLQRVKRQDPELQRIKRQDPVLQRVKREEPELQRFKRADPGLQRVKRDSNAEKETALHRFKRGNDLSESLQRVKRGQDLEMQLARVKRQNVQLVSKEVGLHRYKRARRSIGSHKKAHVGLKKADKVHVHQKKADKMHVHQKKEAESQLHSNEISETQAAKKVDKKNDHHGLAHEHALKENMDVKKHTNKKGGKNKLKKNGTELHRRTDVKKQRKKTVERAEKKNKKHSKKNVLEKTHSKHDSARLKKGKFAANNKRKGRLQKATLALEHQHLLQRQQRRGTVRAHRVPPNLKRTMRAHRVPTNLKRRKSRLLQKARMNAMRAQHRRKRQQLKPVFLHNGKAAPIMHHKRAAKHHLKQ